MSELLHDIRKEPYSKKVLSDLNFTNKVVIVRLDLNVPIDEGTGNITDDTRIRSSLKTLNYLLKDNNCKVVVLSHLGRIKSLDDINSNKKSLKKVSISLQEYLPSNKVVFEENNTDPGLKERISQYENGTLIVLENTRYADIDSFGNLVKRESNNDYELASFWASLGDVFVNDAFGTSHRCHASNVGIGNIIKDSCIGFLVENELENLSKAADNPVKPLVVVFGGSKISDKIDVIKNISEKADYIIIGGAMYNAFRAASGKSIGKAVETDENIDIARELISTLKDKLVLPIDFKLSTDLNDDCVTKKVNSESDEFPEDMLQLSCGPKSIKLFKKYIYQASTIVWNGPIGKFELSSFQKETKKLCRIIANQTKHGAFSLIGGGDSAYAVHKFGFCSKVSWISTGGGASLYYLGSKKLPGIEVIANKDGSASFEEFRMNDYDSSESVFYENNSYDNSDNNTNTINTEESETFYAFNEVNKTPKQEDITEIDKRNLFDKDGELNDVTLVEEEQEVSNVEIIDNYVYPHDEVVSCCSESNEDHKECCCGINDYDCCESKNCNCKSGYFDDECNCSCTCDNDSICCCKADDFNTECNCTSCSCKNNETVNEDNHIEFISTEDEVNYDFENIQNESPSDYNQYHDEEPVEEIVVENEPIIDEYIVTEDPVEEEAESEQPPIEQELPLTPKPIKAKPKASNTSKLKPDKKLEKIPSSKKPSLKTSAKPKKAAKPQSNNIPSLYRRPIFKSDEKNKK